MATVSQLDNKAIMEDIKVSSLEDEMDGNFLVDQRLQGKGIYTREKVRETLRLFQAICRKLLQEEESKLKKPGEHYRVDLKALKLLKEKGKCLRTEKQFIRSMSGVEIGDEFHFRAELSVIGLHRNLVSGIDYMKLGGQSIATSIVSCEGYDNIMQDSDVLIYFGSGGNIAYLSKTEENSQASKDIRLNRVSGCGSGFNQNCSGASKDLKEETQRLVDGLKVCSIRTLGNSIHGDFKPDKLLVRYPRSMYLRRSLA